MRLGIKPAVFLGRLLALLLLTYFLWRPVEPAYTQLLATLTSEFLHLTEMSSDPNFNQVTDMRVRETSDDRSAIFYQHRRFPAVQSGIPAEWVQANLVLLIPLMLATPARTYQQKLWRLALGLGIAVTLQVLDIAVTVKALYASEIPGYGPFARCCMALETRSCRAWTRNSSRSPFGRASTSTSCSGVVRGQRRLRLPQLPR
jgi:hypothetical protein